jgi:hypothetical protein
MDSTRFDRLTMALGTRLSRRRALAGGVASLSAAALSSRLLPASAQDATPEAAVTENPAFLFVQLADSGTWTPKPDEEGIFFLTLSGTGEQTLYFSDRPERIVGTVPTDQFLDALGFTPANPPNAAVLVTTPEGQRDVLVVELFNPLYTRTFGDEGEEFLTYEAVVLNSYQGEALDEWVPQPEDHELPSEFTTVSLFIDDCPDATECWVWQVIGDVPDRNAPSEWAYVGPIPGAPIGQCYNWGRARCLPCNYDREELIAMCDAAYLEACTGYRSIDGMCSIR